MWSKMLYLPVIIVFMSGSAVLAKEKVLEGVVEGVGEAQIEDGNKVFAKEVAIKKALKNCIEQVVGISIRTEFTSNMKETVKNNTNYFEAKIEENLTQKAEGFIKNYKVLEANEDDGIMTVRVQAHVFESKVKMEIKKWASVIEEAGNPVVLTVFQEIIISPEGKATLSEEPQMAATLEGMLTKRGFKMLSTSKVADVLGNDGATPSAQWLNSKDKILKMGREAGADLIIAGRLEVQLKDKITAEKAGGMTSLIGQIPAEIKLTVRGMNAVEGTLFSTKPWTKRETGINVERIMYRTLHGKSLLRDENGKKVKDKKGRYKTITIMDQVFNQLFTDLKTSFLQIAEKGKPSIVELKGVGHYRKQAKPFLKLIQNIDGVTYMSHQWDKKAGRLSINLLYKGEASALQDTIFDKIESVAALSSVDLDEVAGKRISFSL